MAIRISLYDFFAYTVPGVFYLLVVGFAAVVFGLLPADWSAFNDLSLTALIILVGAGYVVGILCTAVAQYWSRLFRSRKQSRIAFREFASEHPWLRVYFEPADWDILLRLLKMSSEEAAADIEHLNVLSIMMRNISFGFGILAGVFVLYYFAVSAHAANLLFAVVAGVASVMAARSGATFSKWYFKAIFAAVAARGLDATKWVEDARTTIEVE